MKNQRQYFKTSLIETIDFKNFCAGGSPEYIKAKKISAESGLHKSEGFPKVGEPKIGFTPKTSSITAYSVSPLAFFDVHFFLIGAAVVVVAVLEKTFAQSGMLSIASALSLILQVVFPIVVFGSMILLISHSLFLL